MNKASEGLPTRAKVERLTDPYLGPRWSILCPWHGVQGRWQVKRQALAALPRHEDCRLP